MAQPIRLFISRDNARLCQAAGKGHLFTIWSALYRSCSFHCQRSWAQGEMDKIQYLSICFVIKFLNLQRVLFFFFHCHLQEKEKKKKTRLTKKKWNRREKTHFVFARRISRLRPILPKLHAQIYPHTWDTVGNEPAWARGRAERSARGKWRGTLKDSSLI